MLPCFATARSRGEVVLVLDDETEIRKRITANGSTLTAKHPDFGNISAPQRYVGKLFQALSVNPIAFLDLPEKAQAEAVLEMLPLEVSREDLRAAVGNVVGISEHGEVGHALNVIADLRRRVFDDRTGVNRAAKEKAATVSQLSESLPEDAEASESAESLESEKLKLERERDAQLRAVGEAERDEIDRARAKLQAEIKALELTFVEATEAIRSRAKVEQGAIMDRTRPEIDALADRIGAARERERQAAATENTRQVVRGLEADVRTLTEQSQELTAALARLDALKFALAEKLPIKGLEVRDGALYLGDTLFRRVNKAEQIKVAVALAKHSAGTVPLVCVDGIEALDGEAFEAFRAEAAKAGLQMIVTRVSPDPTAPDGLQVTHLNELAGV